MEEEKDAFYVVRKGDVVGIYRSLKDCQNQAGSSVCDPPVSVFKGYGLPKEAEEHLASHGFKNASYTISASNVKDGLFGDLVGCPYQQPAPVVKPVVDDTPRKRLPDIMLPAASSFSTANKHFKSNNYNATQGVSSSGLSCILEFGGASKGNPGRAGAGVVIRAEDGLGKTIDDVTAYEAVLLGLIYALQKGYEHIRVQGDSELVCGQIEGTLKPQFSMFADFCQMIKMPKEKFTSFQIKHVQKEFNSEANGLASGAIHLLSREVLLEP